jgi:DNA topoisomerase-1
LPRSIGEFEGGEIVVGLGRFGPFLRHLEKFISIPKTLSPQSINEEEAIQLIRNKRAKEAERIIKRFEEDPDVEVLNGRFGAYITCKGSNYRIPKNMEPTELTLETCREIIDRSPEKAGKKRKASKKK